MQDETLQQIYRRLDVLTTVGINQAAYNQEKAKHDKEMAENMTMLLGMVTAQQRDVREVQTHLKMVIGTLSAFDERLAMLDAQMELRFERIERTQQEQTVLLQQIVARLP